MFRQWTTIAILLLVSVAAVAVENGQVAYIGGTPHSVKEGTIGQFDLSSTSELIFQSPGGNISIPYVAIQSFEFSQEVTHHLGVAPAIAVGLLKKRQRQHFVRISYVDGDNVPQAAVFEVAKQVPRTLWAVLQSRAPQGCKPASTCIRRSN
jgi:hypothetical protein